MRGIVTAVFTSTKGAALGVISMLFYFIEQWEYVMAAMVGFYAIALWLVWKSMESPFYHMMKGNRGEAKEIVAAIAVLNESDVSYFNIRKEERQTNYEA